MLRLDEVAQNGLVVLVEAAVGVAHGLGEAAEDGAVGPRLAHGGDRGPVECQKMVAVHPLQVPVLGLCGGGQEIVGVVGGVGLEVLQDDGEKVLTRQPGLDG